MYITNKKKLGSYLNEHMLSVTFFFTEFIRWLNNFYKMFFFTSKTCTWSSIFPLDLIFFYRSIFAVFGWQTSVARWLGKDNASNVKSWRVVSHTKRVGIFPAQVHFFFCVLMVDSWVHISTILWCPVVLKREGVAFQSIQRRSLLFSIIRFVLCMCLFMEQSLCKK